MNNAVPAFLQPVLWSYDLSKLDIARDKQVILKHILDYGDLRAVTWMHETYSSDAIREAITRSTSSDWGTKSLRLWSYIYNVSPAANSRFA